MGDLARTDKSNKYADDKAFPVRGKGLVGGIKMSTGANSGEVLMNEVMRSLMGSIMVLILVSVVPSCAEADTITVCESGCNNKITSGVKTYYTNTDEVTLNILTIA